jgi:glycosyltransferase involved in cell wall biosynthesis
MSFTPISAVIITYNEELNIERCLNSLVGVADEIVVVDSFSTDKTKSICEKYSVKFFQTNWKGYSLTKNEANNLATNQWILSIDADEALSVELKQSILQLKKKMNDSEVYEFNRLTNYCGKWIRHCGWYPDKKVRIFNKTNCKWEGTIHENIECNSTKTKIHLNGDLLHYSYYSIKGHIDQVNYFTDILAKSMFEKGKKATWINILFSPLVKFLKDYIIKLGFLDGYFGFVISMISAHATFLKYIKLKELYSD